MKDHKLITTVYKGDLAQLYIQAKSLAKFWQGNKRLTIIVDGDSLVQDWCRKNILPILANWNVDFFSLQNLEAEDGYFRQQILRLIAASQSQEEWSIILCAKNILVRDFFIYDLYRDEKVIVDIHDVHSHSHIESATLLGLDSEKLTESWNTTPFCWNTEITKNLLQDLSDKNINLIKLQQFQWTEATLYWNYAQDKTKWYRSRRQIATGIYGGVSLDARLPWQHFLDRIQQSKDDYNVKIFNMHRFHTTPAVVDELFKFYEEIGIANNDDKIFYKSVFKDAIKYQRPQVREFLMEDWKND